MQTSQSPQWRTTLTHTDAEMMDGFRELFFAGFGAAASRGSLAATSEKEFSQRRGSPGAAPSRESNDNELSLQQQQQQQHMARGFAERFFRQFGEVTHFDFDPEWGVGRVVFADGEAGEACYVAAHLSILAAPPDTSCFSDTPSSALVCLVYLEFGAFLPFCNHLLLRKSLLQFGGVSRHFLRTFPSAVSGCEGGTLSRDSLAVLPKDSDDAEALRRILRLLGFADDAHVGALELWRSFVGRYVIRSNPLAARGSPLAQLLTAMDKRAVELVARLHSSTALHCTAAYIVLKLRVEDDSTVGRLLREAEVCTVGGVGESAQSALAALLGAASTAGEDGGKARKVPRPPPLNVLAMAEAALAQPAAGGTAEGALRLIDRYAASGARSSLLTVCAPTPLAAEQPASAGDVVRMLWQTFKWLLVTLGVIAALVVALRFIV